MKHFYLALSAVALMAPMALSAQSAGFANRTIVTGATGTRVQAYQGGYAMYPDMDSMQMMGIEYDGKQCHYSEDFDANKLYIYNPFSYSPTSSYIVGDIKTDNEGNTYAEFEFPQCVAQFDENTFYFAAILSPSLDGKDMLMYTNQTLRINRIDDTWQTAFTSPALLLGMVDQDQIFQFLGERNNVWTAMTDEPVTIPSGLQTGTWDMVYRGTTGHNVTVGFDGDDIYIQGASQDFPYAWIKGTVKENKIIFPSYQLLGVNPRGYYAWMIGGERYIDPIDEAREAYTFDPELVMNYDADESTFSYDKYLLIECSKTKSFTLGRYEKPTFSDPTNLVGDMSPAQPVITYHYPKIGKYGLTWFECDVPSISKSGKLLDKSKLFYKVYLDEEPITFAADGDIYPEVPVPMVEVPWGFDEGWDFITDLNHFKITLNVSGFEYIQVESIYYHNGERLTTMSEPFQSAGVSNISAEEVASIYTDLCGCRVANPAHGVFVKTTLYTDGTRRSTKVAIK